MKANEETLRTLNDLFAEEIEAAIRYLHLSVTVKGRDRLLIRETLLRGLAETLEHAQAVGEQIVRAGGVPGLDLRIEIPARMSHATEATRTALAFEEAALDAYRDLLESVKDKDIPLEEFARAQISVESRHVADLELLLDE